MTVDLNVAWAELASAIKAGTITGHHPAPCSTCGAVTMLTPSRSGRKRVMTPHCEGKHEVTP